MVGGGAQCSYLARLAHVDVDLGSPQRDRALQSSGKSAAFFSSRRLSSNSAAYLVVVLGNL